MVGPGGVATGRRTRRKRTQSRVPPEQLRYTARCRWKARRISRGFSGAARWRSSAPLPKASANTEFAGRRRNAIAIRSRLVFLSSEHRGRGAWALLAFAARAAEGKLKARYHEQFHIGRIPGRAEKRGGGNKAVARGMHVDAGSY